MENDYSTVYSWFDKCGVISNIRTHLRQSLVTALKNKDLLQKFDNSAPKSAKQYVYDLLIAEYLWNHNYVYTLSVLASEAPLLVNFNKHVKTSTSECENKQKLQSDYVFHILETLGIQPVDPKGQSIISDYEDNDVPLLLSILKCISSDNDSFTMKQLGTKVRKNQEVQTVETTETILLETNKIANAKKRLIRQKDLFEAQLKQREYELKKQTLIMEKQLFTLQEKLDQAQKLMQQCTIKEKKLSQSKKQENLRIIQKEQELNMREKLLSQEANRLEREHNNFRQFGDIKKFQSQLSKIKEGPRTEKSCNLSIKDAEVQTEIEGFSSNNSERSLLNLEKQDLHGLVQEQQLRIEQLTSRVVYLSRKLEESRLKNSSRIEIPSLIKVVNNKTVVSESSSTEDILQDAKLRLRRLEEESLRADQYYYNFINNS